MASKVNTSSKTDEEIIYAALGNFLNTDNRRKSRQAFVRIKERITELEARVASLEPCWWNKRKHSEGKAVQKRIWQGKCGWCEAVIEYEEGSLENIGNQGSPPFTIVKCPNCNAELDLLLTKRVDD